MCLGDIVAGMNAVGQWSPMFIASPIVDQLFEGFDAISGMINYWLGIFEEVHFYGVGGNHGRCLTEDTKILTPYGYKTYAEVKIGDLVGTVNNEEKFEFQPIQKIHINENENSLIGIKSSTFEMFVTKDHDVLHRSIDNKLVKSPANKIGRAS